MNRETTVLRSVTQTLQLAWKQRNRILHKRKESKAKFSSAFLENSFQTTEQPASSARNVKRRPISLESRLPKVVVWIRSFASQLSILVNRAGLASAGSQNRRSTDLVFVLNSRLLSRARELCGIAGSLGSPRRGERRWRRVRRDAATRRLSVTPRPWRDADRPDSCLPARADSALRQPLEAARGCPTNRLSSINRHQPTSLTFDTPDRLSICPALRKTSSKASKSAWIASKSRLAMHSSRWEPTTNDNTWNRCAARSVRDKIPEPRCSSGTSVQFRPRLSKR